MSVETDKYSSSRGDGKCWTLDVDIGQKYLGISRGSPEKNLLPVKRGGDAVGGPDISSAPRGLDEGEKNCEPSQINGFLPLDREIKFLSWRAVKSGVKIDDIGG